MHPNTREVLEAMVTARNARRDKAQSMVQDSQMAVDTKGE